MSRVTGTIKFLYNNVTIKKINFFSKNKKNKYSHYIFIVSFSTLIPSYYIVCIDFIFFGIDCIHMTLDTIFNLHTKHKK